MKPVLSSRPFLLAEFFILCVAIPGYIIFSKSAPFMLSFLWGATLYSFCMLRFGMGHSIRELWNWQAVNWTNLKPLLMRWVLASIGMAVFIYFYDNERFFYLPRENPLFIPIIATLYPILSALPQELIFCSFFFARYAPFFGSGRGMVIASAIIFAYAHVLYLNPIAPTLSLLGGLIFAQTYSKTKSLALVSIEHGLYGNMMFITGLGWYFYSGAVETG